MFQETQIPNLIEAGFKASKISTEIMPISPLNECRYYSHNVMIAPSITKSDEYEIQQ